MAVKGAGRIDDELVLHAGALARRAEHAGRHGRAADVAGADEEDADGHGSGP